MTTQTNPHTTWQRQHEAAFSRIRSALRLLGMETEFDWSGVVPAIVIDGIADHTRIVYPEMEPNRQVGIVSPLGNHELSGHYRWTVYVWDLPMDGEELVTKDYDVNPVRPHAELLDVVTMFKSFIDTYLA